MYVELLRDKQGNVSRQCVSFNKICIFNKGFIVDSVISEDDSTMKALLKHRFQDFKYNNPRFLNLSDFNRTKKNTQGRPPMGYLYHTGMLNKCTIIRL